MHVANAFDQCITKVKLLELTTLPGSSPGRIQGFPQDDGVGDKESKGEKKRLDLPWFTQKANNVHDTGLALFTETTGALSVG